MLNHVLTPTVTFFLCLLHNKFSHLPPTQFFHCLLAIFKGLKWMLEWSSNSPPSSFFLTMSLWWDNTASNSLRFSSGINSGRGVSSCISGLTAVSVGCDDSRHVTDDSWRHRIMWWLPFELCFSNVNYKKITPNFLVTYKSSPRVYNSHRKATRPKRRWKMTIIENWYGFSYMLWLNIRWDDVLTVSWNAKLLCKQHHDGDHVDPYINIRLFCVQYGKSLASKAQWHSSNLYSPPDWSKIILFWAIYQN